MQFYIDKVRKHHISPAPGFGPDQGFASGRLAMELVGHTGNWTMYNQIAGLDWDIALLPSGPTQRNRSEVAIEAIGASKDTPHPEACWRFLKFMMSKPVIRAHVDAGYLSIRQSIADHGAHSPDFIEIALDVIQPEIDRALADGRDVDESCRRATQAADDFIATLGTERREHGSLDPHAP
jgi:ABC-type glycerol-3-phosphate transport system substrate-binding protein